MTAGLGTRMRPFTDDLAKPLLPVLGIPTCQYAMDLLAAAGVKKAVANLHHLPQKTQTAMQRLDRGAMELLFSDESAQLLGSSGGIRKALPTLSGVTGEDPFFVVNADVICNVNFSALAAHHRMLRKEKGVRVTLMILPGSPAPEVYTEISIDYSTSLISGLKPKTAHKPRYAGVAVVEPEAIRDLPDGEPSEFVPQVLEPAIRDGKAGAFLAAGLWLDIGEPKAWWLSHFHLLRAWELRQLPAPWQRRLNLKLRYLKPGVCVGPGLGTVGSDVLAGWKAPTFWWPDVAPGAPMLDLPAQMGPNVVFYGDPKSYSDVSALQDGIGFAGRWTSFKTSKS